ncbi:MotA/TolQ/ExbB proton channel family protein [Novosphingobium sp.]|uniref:MotA/TolQ/ExbB proton channel family protein n=1 Tax=Novosphingobium sp. TaxID=1874826 RepID=UPI0035ADB9DF
MNLMNLIDGPSAAIVLGGTLVATWLRAGNRDCRTTLRQLCQLGRRRFDAAATRAELALQVQEIRQDGLLRAQPHRFGDSEFDDATDALIGRRSVGALIEAHEAHRARRIAQSERAVRTLAQAAELAPVFGLAGTLVSLSQLPSEGLARGAFMGTISMAVVTTLYGLLAANLVFAPLARILERAAQAEEAERQEVIDWLAAQVSEALPVQRRQRREYPGSLNGDLPPYDIESAA